MSTSAEREAVVGGQDRADGGSRSHPLSVRGCAITGEGVAGDTENTTHHTSRVVSPALGEGDGGQEGVWSAGMEDTSVGPVELEEGAATKVERKCEEEEEEEEDNDDGGGAYHGKDWGGSCGEEGHSEGGDDNGGSGHGDGGRRHGDGDGDGGDGEGTGGSEEGGSEEGGSEEGGSEEGECEYGGGGGEERHSDDGGGRGDEGGCRGNGGSGHSDSSGEDWDRDSEDVFGEDTIDLLLDDPEVRVAVFRILFLCLLQALLRCFCRDNHTLVRSRTGPGVVRARPLKPEDRGEALAPPEGEDVAERVLPVGPEEPKKPTEGAASREPQEPTAKARVREGENITGAVMSYEMGACAPKEAKAGRWRQHPRALVASVGAAGSLAGRVQGLPHVVKRRINALKNLQAQYAQIKAQFYKDLYKLELKYAAVYQPLFDKRSDIINAICEPTEEECQWQGGIQEGVLEEVERDPEGQPQINGIPRFWLTAFKNIKILRKLIQKTDEPVLEHLKDVKIRFSEVEEPMSFTIEFVFKSNEYFFNEVLTKTYYLRSYPDDSDHFFSKGPEIISITGCEIYWKPGKNLTVKTVKLQQREGHGSTVSTRSKVPSPSFFSYFYPPDSPQGRLLGSALHYALAYIFREILVPKSVLVFTKEATECRYENSDEESHESGSDEKEDEENEEPEEGPPKDPGPAEGIPRESSWKA